MLTRYSQTSKRNNDGLFILTRVLVATGLCAGCPTGLPAFCAGWAKPIL